MKKLIILTTILTFNFTQVCFSESNLRKTDLAIILTSNAIDYTSTKYALKNCNSCIEGNPLMRNRLEVGKLAISLIEIGGVKYLRSKGKNKTANIFLIILGTVSVGVAVNNVRIGRK